MDSNPINLANLFKQAQEAFADQFNLEQVVAGSDTRVLFVARDRVLKRKVALRIHPTPGGTSREWFEKETELMAELDHPSIRGVYSAGYKGDWAYRVTKWITGESLADAVERQPRSIPFVLHLAQDLTYALEYAHSRQIIIRRMIPSTIIIDRMPRAIITDLRYANRCLKFADPDDEPSANNFLAPETWHGGFGEPASDIYALAAIVYFALTGQPPDSNPLNIITPSKLRAKCPAIFDRILMRALSHDARNRYFNVEDMRADLASEMGRVDTPVSAAPTNSLRSDPKAWEKHLRRALGDQYELMNELGTGGFGTVYRVRDLSLERDVALKVLHPFLTEDPTVVERFRKEAQLAAKLDHPNIVAIYGIGHRSGLWWYTMEYIPGLNLAQAIQARGPLEFDDWLTAMTQALNALHHAHQHDLVHRDLKPENMLIDSRDGNLNIT
ncbi:MAG: serine/threonine-protein kinase, partial [Gemmatimonadota bacterium]|nr:serine/threonine-protein kinase [Gemmatimonadota bacterium]